MNGDDRTEDVQLLIEEAAYRLRWAQKYDPGDDPRVLCENAHEAIEAALNTVIVAAGKRYRSSHDLGHLANVAADAGQPLPAELEGIGAELMVRPGSNQIELDGLYDARADFEGIDRSAGGGSHGPAGTLHGAGPAGREP